MFIKDYYRQSALSLSVALTSFPQRSVNLHKNMRALFEIDLSESKSPQGQFISPSVTEKLKTS